MLSLQLGSNSREQGETFSDSCLDGVASQCLHFSPLPLFAQNLIVMYHHNYNIQLPQLLIR